MSKTSAPEWAKRVRRWQQSGVTAREFGQRHGIDPRQLSWWKWHLNKRGELQGHADAAVPKPDEPGTAIRLLPVQVVHAAQPAHPEGRPRPAVVEVGLRNGRVVRVAEDADLEWLAELLAVVEAGGAPGC